MPVDQNGIKFPFLCHSGQIDGSVQDALFFHPTGSHKLTDWTADLTFAGKILISCWAAHVDCGYIHQVIDGAAAQIDIPPLFKIEISPPGGGNQQNLRSVQRQQTAGFRKANIIANSDADLSQLGIKYRVLCSALQKSPLIPYRMSFCIRSFPECRD